MTLTDLVSCCELSNLLLWHLSHINDYYIKPPPQPCLTVLYQLVKQAVDI